jgi:lipoprotein signal peptidase
MINNKYIKNVLAAAVVAALGFLLLNLAFILDWAFQSLLLRLFPMDADTRIDWIPAARHILFLVLILLLTWPVLRSNLKPIFKAAYLTVPAAVTFAAVGMFFSQWPSAMYGISVLIYGGTVYFLYRRRMPWLYYYSVTLAAGALLTVGLLGIDI